MVTSTQSGFTLVELMIAVSVATVLIMVASPSVQQSINNSRLSTAAAELTGAVQVARAEAIRRNRRVTLCRSADGSSCDASTGGWTGWMVFVDQDGNGVRGTTEAIIKTGTFDASLNVLSSAAISGQGELIAFRGDGLARTGNGLSSLTATISVCMPTLRPAENARDVRIAAGSRTVVARRNGLGACSAPANA